MCFLEDGQKTQKTFTFTKAGIASFLKQVPEGALCVMESTGNYHVRLADALYEAGKRVSVANPLSVKRYSQMLLGRTKTDRKDALTIAQYAKMNEEVLRPFQPEADELVEVRQLMNLLEQYRKQDRQLANLLESVSVAAHQSKSVKRDINKTRGHLIRQIEKTEKEIVELINRYNKEDYERLKSIPGLGAKTAAVLIAVTSGMSRFENYRQVCSYFGMAPRVYESGKSVRGTAKICKMGMSTVRKMLYMCALSAKNHNPACKDLYDRLVAAGKAKMVALIAVAHKLIKIAFALIKNKTTYDANFFQKKLAL